MSIEVLGVDSGGRGLGWVSWNNIKIYKNRTLFCYYGKLVVRQIISRQLFEGHSFKVACKDETTSCHNTISASTVCFCDRMQTSSHNVFKWKTASASRTAFFFP
jgi:hypothetical protein